MPIVESSRGGERKVKLLGSHQKCWIWGRHVVTETLRAGKWRPVELLLADSLPEQERAQAAESAHASDIPVRIEPANRLRRLCRSDEHQGYLAKMPEFPYDTVDDLFAHAVESPLFVILDGVQDPYNLGAIVRSADVFGANGLFLKHSGQVGVTSLVARTSAGAVNFVPIARAEQLESLVVRLQENGTQVVATHQSATLPLQEFDFCRSVAVIIGNESVGVSETLRNCSDHLVRIPQQGHVESLNAAVAAGIVLYEAARQRIADCGLGIAD